MNIESTQACCLGCYVLYDAYAQGLIEEKDIDELFAVVKSEIAQYEQEIAEGTFEKTTKLLDCTLIAEAFAAVAKELGRTADYEYLSRIASYWTVAFGKDGLLKTEYPYYEGNHWNYSFRFVNDVQKRIAVSGGKEQLEKQADFTQKLGENGDIMQRIFAFVEENYLKSCTLADLASALGYNHSYISRLFMRMTGMHYNSYVNMRRLSSASYLLRNSDISVLECSIESGYRSLRSFNRNFKEFFGISPAEYRSGDDSGEA